MIETIVEAVHRWTCDGCGEKKDVPSNDPTQSIADWVAVCVYPMRSRPEDTSSSGSKNFCGPCADTHKLRPLLPKKEERS